jgi:hypothetical protein
MDNSVTGNKNAMALTVQRDCLICLADDRRPRRAGRLWSGWRSLPNPGRSQERRRWEQYRQVDEITLIDALRTGQIRGAALDVLQGKPEVNPDLRDVEGLALTPHTASASEATRDTVGILALDNASAVLAG